MALEYSKAYTQIESKNMVYDDSREDERKDEDVEEDNVKNKQNRGKWKKKHWKRVAGVNGILLVYRGWGGNLAVNASVSSG